MSKNGGGEPKGELKTSMDKAFGTFDGFKEAFTKAALGQFGSGWAWLCWDPATKGLTIQATANQDSPLMGSSAGTEGTPSEVLRKRYGIKEATHIPLLGLDVWEHAYYLKYQNRRADYVAAFYHVINWDFVSERFATATKA
jgi:Fe-Mn family superoxide dismutase